MRNLWKTYINVLNVCLTHQNLLSVFITYSERTERVYNLRVAYMRICQSSLAQLYNVDTDEHTITLEVNNKHGRL